MTKRSPQGHKLNWRRDRPRLNDKTFAIAHGGGSSSPIARYDFRTLGWCPPIVDQGQEGDCTGESSTGAIEILGIKNDPNFDSSKGVVAPFAYSAQFAYWNARAAEGDTDQDGGAQIRDVVQGLEKYGCCLESTWPTKPNTLLTAPPLAAFTEAATHKIAQAVRIDNTKITQIKSVLLMGFPIVFGITAFNSIFPVGNDGLVPMPGAYEDPVGGHALCMVGYNDSIERFVVRNSWGVNWGDQGYGYFPYAYLTNPDLASDFWGIEK